ncbi:ribonuclease H-like domain-containing protein [Tanacetum coccineum]|uniref:Ribonuclease H-like domain-containing protein n=1 Tax=Tanacetum coccineum TaxID=301880 RepID=A0ABQ5CFP4_9ASTR
MTQDIPLAQQEPTSPILDQHKLASPTPTSAQSTSSTIMGHTTQSGQTTFPHQLTTHSTQSTSGPNTVQQPTRTHPMATRAQVGTFKPNPRFHGHTTHISPLPKSPAIALSDANWPRCYHKYHANGSLSRYKARLVANGRSQQYGVNCDDTFSPVVKLATIRTVLSLTLSRNWPYSLRVHLVLGFNGLRDMHYELGFLLSRCVADHYLLFQAWFLRLHYLLIIVDVIVLKASSTSLLQLIISSLHKEFDMTDLGALNYFLGISVTRDSIGMFLSQKKYTMELLDQTHMASFNPTQTPVDTVSKLGADRDLVSDPTLYHSLVGDLQYLTFIRPDISYVVHQVCLYMHDPREPYFSSLKRILRYVRATLDFGLQLYASSTRSLVAYSDADWAGCPTTRHSTSETTWLRNLLRELHTPLLSATLVYCDNVSAIYLTANPV